MTIESKELELDDFRYKAVFEIERDGETKFIEENLITNELLAQKRAIAEFLDSNKQEIEFSTYFVDIKINDIIKVSAPTFRVPKELNKDRFIIKNIKHYFKNGYLKTKIKAVRYD